MLFATNILVLLLVPSVIRAMTPGKVQYEYSASERPEIEVSHHLIHVESCLSQTGKKERRNR